MTISTPTIELSAPLILGVGLLLPQADNKVIGNSDDRNQIVIKHSKVFNLNAKLVE
jgi:hypothetical protein